MKQWRATVSDKPPLNCFVTVKLPQPPLGELWEQITLNIENPTDGLSLCVITLWNEGDE